MAQDPNDGRPEAVVVDDSRFMRDLIADILDDGGVDVVATAGNGAAAVEAVCSHEPDVVTMDVEMPEVGGLEAVERIMERVPTPIVMLSAHTEAEAEITFEALDRGAVEFMAKPGGEVSTGLSRRGADLAETVRSVADADPDLSGAEASPAPPTVAETDAPTTVIIASSTGGPDAAERVVGTLPADADVRALVVQHMPPAFTGRFAERLDEASSLSVREAQDGDRVGSGEAVVAPGDAHLEASNYRRGRLRVKLTDDAAVDRSVVPAADVTMRSAAAAVDDHLVGVVLTGMGSDAAAGVRAIAEAGGRVVAQDEETSVIYGMPRRAVETGCVDEVLPLERVAAGVVGESR